MIKILTNNHVYIDRPPLEVDIYIEKDKKPMVKESIEIANIMIKDLEDLYKYIEKLKVIGSIDTISSNYNDVLNNMIKSTKKMEDKDLNLLASVAGSFSEKALKESLELGADRIQINNGGDIALFDKSQSFKVLLPISKYGNYKDRVMTIDPKDNIYGISTSGISGRGLNKGIADFVTVFSKKSSLSDAAATHLSNQTYVEDDEILRVYAEEIDSMTDIKGQKVTVKVGNISQKTIYKGILQAYERAEYLKDRGLIHGMIVGIKDTMLVYPKEFKRKLKVR